jgi:hypothetical protein
MGPHFLADGLEIKEHSTAGRGVFATRRFVAGELLAVWGGWIITTVELNRLRKTEQTYAVQVEEDLYLLTPRSKVAGADFINHSCDPNAGLEGSISLVAIRGIEPGEEVSYDYAMADSNPHLGFDCSCGSALCRVKVTGEDWRNLRLQQAYDGHFSPYLQRRVTMERERIAREAVAVQAQAAVAQAGAQASNEDLAPIHRMRPRVRKSVKLVAVQR